MDNSRQLNGHSEYEHREIVLQPPSMQGLSVNAYSMPAAPQAETTDDLAVLMQFVRILWKRKWLLAASTALGMAAAAIVSLWITPLYSARTSLEIQNVQEPFNIRSVGDPAVVTQTQLLSSSSMRQRAISKLSARTERQVPQVAGPLASLRRFLGLTEPVASISWGQALGDASGKMKVTNTRDSRVLVITTESPNPQAAADFTNTLAQEYIAKTREDRLDAYQKSGEWLTDAQRELKGKAEQAEQRLVDFAKAKGLVFAGNQNISEDKLKQLQSQLLAAQAERIAKQAIYESSQKNPSEALPSVLDNGPMMQYETKLADLRREKADLSATLTPSHFRVQRVQAQIEELEKERDQERTNIINRIQIEYQAALKRENDLRGEYDSQSHFLANQSDDVIQYNLLQRDVDTNNKLYETALEQGKEASLASAMRASSARIVDRAYASRGPSWPNLPLNLVLGTFAGLGCGALFVIVKSRTDARIQAPGMLSLQMNLRELGVIPAASLEGGIRSIAAGLPRAIGAGGKNNGSRGKSKLAKGEDPTDCLELVTWNRKPSPIAEAFRATMTSIMFLGENGERPKVLVVTSPSPQEGKSTVVSNLAIALAEINQRVLLIDADLRLPRLHTIFDVPNTFGLTDVLHERKPVQEYVIDSMVRKTHIPELYVLPAGPARANLSRLLYSSRMKDLVTRLRDTFDAVLIDTAPVLTVPDSRILARVADGVILVLRAHKTHQEAAYAAVRSFAEDGRRILGTILNDWNPRMSVYGEYGSYYSSYYSYYNPSDER